jgi:capsular polysaccharide transport system permease protein
MVDDRTAASTAVVAKPRPAKALERSTRVRDALRQTVRALRSSSRRRKAFDVGAFARRRDARLFSLFVKSSFVLVFLLPSLSALIYYTFIASPQYVAETRFTVQGGTPAKLDAFSVVTGLPSVTVVQDTQVVTNYIESPSIVQRLQDKLDLRRMYGDKSIDRISRFDDALPIEKLVDYWKTKEDVSIQLPGGIVTVTVRAFTAQDALRIADEVLVSAEALVNDLNNRMLEDNVSASRTEFERAALRLGNARAALETARNTAGILDPQQTATDLGVLISTLKLDLLSLQRDYASQGKTVSTDAPQMRALSTRIKAMSAQIAELEARITGKPNGPGPEGVISDAMTKFSELETERRIAEQQYVSAASAFELARLTSERRLIYLKTFLRPALPEQARYPRRVLNIALISFGTFFVWAILCGLLSLARNHMA